MSATAMLDEDLIRELRKIHSLRPAAPGTVLISVTDQDRIDHHVVLPIPESYEAAKSLAFSALSRHIPSSSISQTAGSPKAPSLLQTSSLAYALLSAGGDVIWSKLPPQFWSDIIADGDQLRLLIQPQPSLFDWDWGNAGRGDRFAKFLLLGTPSEVEAQADVEAELESIVVPLPRSYQDARRFALTTFYTHHPPHGISLSVRRRVGGAPKWVALDPYAQHTAALKDWLAHFDDIFLDERVVEIGVGGR